jgi:WD40 repeat protein
MLAMMFNLTQPYEQLESAGIICMVIAPDGKTVISASTDKTLAIWDVARGSLKYRFNHNHTKPITHMAVTPDSQTVIAASQDTTLSIWNITNGTQTHQLLGHNDLVSQVVITSDGDTAVSVSGDHFGGKSELIVWDIHTGNLQHRLQEHRGRVTHVPYSITRRLSLPLQIGPSLCGISPLPNSYGALNSFTT